MRPAGKPAEPGVAAIEPLLAEDLRGLSQLVIGAIHGVTDIVEDVHRNILRRAPITGAQPTGRTRGITGFVYRSVRGVTGVVGFGLDRALNQLAPLLGSSALKAMPRENLLAILNGVMGDHLAQTGNPLALPMRFRHQGEALQIERDALRRSALRPGNKLLVQVHGLCMNDLDWLRAGHDHGAALARELGYTPIHLHYNSGRRISANGRDFADALETLLDEWPVAVEELVILGHSMGGLVARSACHYAQQAEHAWLDSLRSLVCLGTPHHGAPLERAGNGFNAWLGASPYTAPFTRLGRIRSAGVQDLRHGNTLDEHWQHGSEDHPHDLRRHLHLPAGVHCHVIAGSKLKSPRVAGKRIPGDGLVPVESALGLHTRPELCLQIPHDRQAICYATNHFELLSSPTAYEHIHRWLK